MSVYDHHSLMTLKLDRWRDEPTLRGFEIELELIKQNQPEPLPCRPRSLWQRLRRYLGFHRSARAAS